MNEREAVGLSEAGPRQLWPPIATVLLVAADKDLLELLAFTLERHGLIPVLARDGLAALRLARARRPQVAVVDYRAAVYDGPLVLRHLRRLGLPLLVLTSSCDRALALTAGVQSDELLIKPISPNELIERLHAYPITSANWHADRVFGVIRQGEPPSDPRLTVPAVRRCVRQRFRAGVRRSGDAIPVKSSDHCALASRRQTATAVALLLVAPMLLYQRAHTPTASGLTPVEMASTPPIAQATSVPAAQVPSTRPAATATLAAVAPTAPATMALATRPPAATTPPPDPAETVLQFYQLLQDSDFENITPLLSGRMRDTVPWDPKLLRERTPSGALTIERAETIDMDPSSREATVAVAVVEQGQAQPKTKRYVGTWQLVRGPIGWQLDQPDLHVE